MNIREIARIANVTPGTVSKVLNNYPDISEATRQHVKEVIEEYQYTPNFGSRNYHNTNTTTIGLVTEGAFNYLYSEMHQMLSTKFHNAGYTILSYCDNYFVQNKTEKFEEILKYMTDHKVIGFVYIGGNFANVPEEYFKKLPCPTIFVDCVLPTLFTEATYSSVQTNDYECAKMQMDLLIQKGHRKIAMVISSKDDNSIYGLRYQGYLAALNRASLQINLDHVIEGQYVFSRTYKLFKDYMEKNPDTTAVCVNADIMTPAVLRVLADMGKEVGTDIDVISFDGLSLTDYLVPRVTCFQQPKQEIVDSVYDLLIGLLSNEKKHQHIAFKNQIMIRESLTL